MNKKMRELLTQIEAKRKEARGFQDAKDSEKAMGTLSEMDELQKSYEIEEKLFKAEQADVNVLDLEKNGKDTDMNKDEKAFVDFIKGTEKSLTAGANGAIIPTTIANKIIEAVKELSPIYAKATIYNAKGILSIPVYGDDAEGEQIEAGYATEFTDIVAAGGKFTSVDLGSNTVGALTKISKSLINNTDIDVLTHATGKIAKSIADFIEKEMIAGAGTTGKMTGAIKTTNIFEAAGATAITAEDLIDVQLSVPELYQADACWILNKATFKTLRKLKDGDGNFLLIRDFVAGAGWLLLGKTVYISENMPSIAAATVAVLYGDFSGMAVKLAKSVEIQILSELFAAQHAVGVVGWAELDSKIENSQKFVALKMKAGA